MTGVSSPNEPNNVRRLHFNHVLRNSSGSFATLTAIRRASCDRLLENSHVTLTFLYWPGYRTYARYQWSGRDGVATGAPAWNVSRTTTQTVRPCGNLSHLFSALV